ncbi:MAG: adenosylcobinamide-GDP ribazoletransferase [Beijerinckiaceae bacterium]|nr:adenosylcobinamide-GDP ribazoletransferase [Beijerinckiaceae bacterium]
MAEAIQDEVADAREAEPVWPGWLVATAICLRFYSRLPVPRMPGEGDIHTLPDFRLVPRAVPLAALVIGLPAALVALGAGLAGVSPLLAATLAVTALVLTTGGLHEDGLADSADGLFGGQTPERRLEIMKDSRIGSYGALALGLSLLLRVTALSAILTAAGPWGAAGAVLIAAIMSRSTGVALVANHPPARPAGASAAVGRPTRGTVWWAAGLTIVGSLAIAIGVPMSMWGLAIGSQLTALAVIRLGRLAERLIGGQTGDIVGAAQQIAEIAVYLGFALALSGVRP